MIGMIQDYDQSVELTKIPKKSDIIISNRIIHLEFFLNSNYFGSFEDMIPDGSTSEINMEIRITSIHAH